MTELVLLSLQQPWMKFILEDLKKSDPLPGDGGEDLQISLGEITEKYKPQEFLASVSDKKIALVTHPGMGELAEFMGERGVSIINGGKLADAAHENPEFVTLQAAKHRFLVSGDAGDETKGYVLCVTSRGILDQWLEYDLHRGLAPGLQPTDEGITLRISEEFDENVTRKIERMVSGWGFLGFLFVTMSKEGEELWIHKITPFGPPSFWPAFCKGFEGNLLKFFLKMEKSRKRISKFSFVPTTVLKLSLPPYPYHSTPWVDKPEERKLVENWLRLGSVGVPLKEPEGEIVWLNVNEELVTTGPEVAFVCVHEGDLKEVARIARDCSDEHFLQYKGALQ